MKCLRSMGKISGFPLSFLGLSLLLVWEPVVFYTTNLVPSDVFKLETFNLSHGTFLLSASALFLIFTVLDEKNKRIIIDSRVQVPAAISVAVGTIFIFIGAHTAFEVTNWLNIVGPALSGIGTAPLILGWASFYRHLNSDLVEKVVPLTMVVLAALFVFLYSFPGPLSLVITVALPLVSLSLLSISRNHPYAAEATDDSPIYSKVQGFPLPTTLGFLVVAFSYRYPLVVIMNESDLSTTAPFLIAFVIGAALALLFSFLFIYYADKMRLVLLFQIAIPLIALCFIAVAALPLYFNIVVFATSFSVMFLTKIFIFVLGSQPLKLEPSSLRSVSIGSALAAVFIGEALADILYRLISNHGIMLVAVISITALASLILLALASANKRATEYILKNYDNPGAENDTFSMIRNCKITTETYGLSKRESEILTLIVRGRDFPYIREKLFISRNTVNTHIKHIYAKTAVHSRQELIDIVEGIDKDNAVSVKHEVSRPDPCPKA